MKISSVLMTVPPRVNEARRSLESARVAGLDPLVVIDLDGIGPYPMFRRAVEAALNGNCSHVAILQDDIRLAAKCSTYLERIEDVEAMSFRVGSIFSLFTSARNQALCESQRPGYRGWFEASLPTHADGAQAYVIPVTTARRFLRDAPHTERRAQVDHWVGMFCRNCAVDYYVHSPSLCLHSAPDQSTLPEAGIPECRQCSSWVRSVDPWTVEEVIQRGA